jgi:predicted small integral membrane protein
MMTARLAKIALLDAMGLYLALVVLNNLTDYGSNYAFVAHVLAMDTTFPGNALLWRAIHSTSLYRAAYAGIIAWEALACGLIFAGGLRLWRMRRGTAAAFNGAKGLAVAGLTVNLLQWLVAFVAIGGEWFLMWQSRTWNGNDTAGRMFIVGAVILLFVNQPDEDVG